MTNFTALGNRRKTFLPERRFGYTEKDEARADTAGNQRTDSKSWNDSGNPTDDGYRCAGKGGCRD